MKRVFLTLVIGLMTMVGYGQQFYPFKKNNITYYGMEVTPEMFLNHLGINYTSPDDRLICLDSLSKNYMEHFKWENDKILMSFEKHKKQNADSNFTLNVDANRVIMTEKEFFQDNKWNDELSANTIEMIGNMGSLIIGMKEWSIPKNTKPFKVDFYGTLDLTLFKSIIVVESYLPNYNQVSSSLFLKTIDNRLVLGGGGLRHVLGNYAKK